MAKQTETIERPEWMDKPLKRIDTQTIWGMVERYGRVGTLYTTSQDMGDIALALACTLANYGKFEDAPGRLRDLADRIEAGTFFAPLSSVKK